MISLKKVDFFLVIPIFFLISLSVLILNSISPYLFPNYYLYILTSVVLFVIFSNLDYEIISFFSRYIYWFSIFLLVLVLFVGKVTRGSIRWIPLGSFSIQPAEIVRPFLIIFWANYLASKKLTIKRFAFLLVLFFLPVSLILIQPSLGVSILTAVSFLGVVFSLPIDKKKIFLPLFFIVLAVPLIYSFLAPYQKQRIKTFLSPTADPFGAGYNSIQSMMAVGAGQFFGRGLGKGVQTQLQFLPEKHTDFVFAAIAEEMGFVGSLLVLFAYLFLFWRLAALISETKSVSVRAFISGLFFTLLVQVFVNIGMNMGIVPVTGVTLPLLSAGGSSLISIMISLGLVNGISKRK